MSSAREVLQRLIAGPVSGDTLAREAGLTRAAMWKRIEALREAGVDIVVAGSAVFGAEDRAAMIQTLRG